MATLLTRLTRNLTEGVKDLLGLAFGKKNVAYLYFKSTLVFGLFGLYPKLLLSGSRIYFSTVRRKLEM